MRINDIWDHVIVNMAALAGDGFDTSNPIFFTLVSEHRSLDYIANGVQPRKVSSELFVDGNATSFGQLQPQIFCHRTIQKWFPSNRDQNLVGWKLEILLTFGFGLHKKLPISSRDARDLGVNVEFQALSFQRLV